MAGELSVAEQVCREFTMRVGWCVTVTPTKYIYTGGQESGFIVESINYARFPAEREKINSKAEELADLLREACCQRSYTLMTPLSSDWVTFDVPSK